ASKDREDPLYRAAFPHGLSAIVSLRGEEESRAVHALLQALATRAPKLEKEHKAALEALCKATVHAEQEWKKAETAVASAPGGERIARTELARRLQKNEGALLAISPAQKRRVRSFFRPPRRGGAAPDPAPPTA